MKKFLTKKVVFVGFTMLVLLSTLVTTILVYNAYHRTAPSVQSAFVTRSGSQLLLRGQPFRFSGPNIYWLGLDGNLGSVAYPTNWRYYHGGIHVFTDWRGHPRHTYFLSIRPSLAILSSMLHICLIM